MYCCTPPPPLSFPIPKGEGYPPSFSPPPPYLALRLTNRSPYPFAAEILTPQAIMHDLQLAFHLVGGCLEVCVNNCNFTFRVELSWALYRSIERPGRLSREET